ncbi:hypothetical protein [Aerococcus sp. UMB7834]|nr:hypothetical protein [Aerococcus sp. UMB7834]
MDNWGGKLAFFLSASLTFALIEWIKKKYLYEDKDQDKRSDNEKKEDQ